MGRTIKLMQLLVLLALTACAPVVYETTYREIDRPPRHGAAVGPAHGHGYHGPAIPSIEVTLYGDYLYPGGTFTSMVLVIADEEFVHVPVRDRHGRDGRLFAHYHQRNLHFDIDRNCRNGRGYSNFGYDRRWETGHEYHNLYAGSDYDTRGMKLRIQNRPQGRARDAGYTSDRRRETDTSTVRRHDRPTEQTRRDNQGRPIVGRADAAGHQASGNHREGRVRDEQRGQVARDAGRGQGTERMDRAGSRQAHVAEAATGGGKLAAGADERTTLITRMQLPDRDKSGVRQVNMKESADSKRLRTRVKEVTRNTGDSQRVQQASAERQAVERQAEKTSKDDQAAKAQPAPVEVAAAEPEVQAVTAVKRFLGRNGRGDGN